MTLATGVATTSTGTSVRTSPAAAVITARPGASAMTTPSADTSATRDAELRQVIVSSRSSLAADHEAKVTAMCEWLANGPRGAMVTNVETTDVDPVGERGFDVTG